MAYFDSLTGLPNRTLFLDRLGQALHLARREKRALGVIFLDLDNFKKINDTLGHNAGDQVLKIVAERLKGHVRKSDTLSRPGGDEFAIAIGLSSTNEDREILTTIEHFQKNLEAPVNLSGMEIFINGSLGIALYPNDGESADELLKYAELAMYEGKSTGGGTFRFYSREMNQRASKRLQLEVDLHRALREEEIFLLYQPQVSAGDGRVTGVEALTRWRHPTLGTLSPDQFIPLAEETGLILPLGEWILRQACLQTRRWQEMGFTDLRLGVNLSPIQFRRSDIPAMVQKVLTETGFDPRFLELEITEGVLLQKDKGRSECLRKLKNMGISLAIDDFGTGYSSLSYLKQFPIDRLKVAQEFVREIPASIEHLEIIRAIVAMARSLKLNVIAEGVETREQLKLITEMGIDDIQGYYFSRPLPDEDILPFVRQIASRGVAPPT
ncbi:putative bifunctional diguanylate cyclase/phosphodiesterase [Trichloromonas sp.]|uniref:putative bifunctional diguanylate cyclase/phosphodiesterase n=1 Tax=Trichloromonas sp. TaxID=3069249 RepID=UPI002A43318F|nr:EAL domain-containing protein [Trichloromonas sp.]